MTHADVSASSAPTLTKTRRMLAAAATLTTFGIGLSAAENEDIGKWVTLTGLALLLYGLHRFGRTGPDEPIEVVRPKKKKKKKKKAEPQDEAPQT